MLGPLLLAIFFLAVLWWLSLTRIKHEESQEIQNAIKDNSHLSALVEANLTQLVGGIRTYSDIALALRNGQSEMAAHLKPTVNGDRAFLKLALFDLRGGLLYSSARQQSEPELAAFVDNATHAWSSIPPPQAVVIGRPLTTSDAWSVPLLTGIGSGKQSSALFVAVLDLGYFLQLFQKAGLETGSRIEIIGADGYQLVESSAGTLSSGRGYQGSDYLRFLLKGSSGAGLVARDGDQTSSVSAYSRSDNYPLIVVVSRDTHEVLTAVSARRSDYLRWASFVSVLLLAGAFALAWLAQRQRASHQALIDSEAEKQGLIAQLEAEKNHAYQLASHDHLTGLPNRLLFAELAKSHVSRARRSRRHHALLFIDLDRFKTINDTLGHRVGDLLLIEVARRFRSCLRESDVVARVGGDEFVMLLNDAESVQGFVDMAEKIIALINEPFVDLDGHTVETTPSIGIALYPRDGEDIELLLRHADAAMYAAKAAGRGTYRFHDQEMNKQTLRELELLQGLRRAVRQGEFVLHYQPRVALRDFSLSGLEALIRWQNPDIGLIYPNDFIALAEEHDLISTLGSWVIDSACEQIADWRRREIPLVPVAINISARQFRNDRLVADICDALVRHEVPAKLLEIEITESCLVDRPERVAEMLAELVGYGINISMDDYGTGFASLSYLKTLPLHAIKIDRSFIREILNDTNDEMIVSSTTTLAHNLKLSVVAEGVETKAQLIHLKTIGCDHVQGYYFHRPLPASEIEAVLTQGIFLK